MTQRVNGPHDLGGLPGFGPVPIGDDSGSPYPEGWEGRVIGAIVGSLMTGLFNGAQFRARMEGIPTAVYLESGYYRRWLHTLEDNLVRNSIVTEDEIERRLQELAADPAAAPSSRSDPAGLAAITDLIEAGAQPAQAPEVEPAFEIGDRVRAREIRIERRGEDHTRLPGYVQSKHGVIELVHPPADLPDVMVAGGPGHPEHVYTVRFESRQLWPDSDGTSVCVDLWESYLDPA